MKAFRPHRFPPLSSSTSLAPSGVGHGDQWQASVADGFKQGMEEGLRQGREDGYSQGRTEGYAAGLQQGSQDGRDLARHEMLDSFEALAGPMERLLENLERQHADYQSAKRKEVVELVARVARQVIRCELTLQPVQLLALVEETLAGMPPVAEGGIEVHLNAEDLRRIRELDPKRFRRWTLLADPRLESGECRVRAGDQEVDAGCNQRLSACMERVSAQLLEAAERSEAVNIQLLEAAA